MRTIQSLPRSALRLSFALEFVLAAGCGADLAADGEEPDELSPVAEKQQAVIGGTPAIDCQWPSTVRVDPAQCTGTLIHPRVVTTAAHCLTSTTASIGFGARGAATSFSVSARCVAGARGSSGGNTARDWAYCILPEDPRIAKIPIAPPLVGCEAALVKAGSSAWVVGYGSTTPRGAVGGKRQVEVTINQFNKLAPGTIDVGDRYKGACHGDSGGPLYVHLTRNGVDYGIRTLGSTSGAGGNCDCTCSTTYVNLENHVKAIEKNEGIDVTPCTDSAGNWEPSAACGGFQSAPETGTGTWPECTVARTTQPIESCGPGGVVSADAGVDGGAALDGGARIDGGARTDAGAGTDGGARADASTETDAGDADAAAALLDAGAVQVRDAALAAADTGAASVDASSYAGDAATGVITSPVTGVIPPAGDDDDGGCSLAPSVGGAGTLAPILLALALSPLRRRRRGCGV